MAEDDDPYLIPGTQVLRNRLGCRDAADLRQAEYLITAQRTADAPAFPLTADGFRALHRHLFGEVYDWAGELRTVNISKGGTGFAPVRFLGSSLETVFRDLSARGNLRGLPAERFAEQAAHHTSELNVVHAYREGNGRAMRIHLDQLAAQAGHPLDVTRMPGPDWIRASIQGFAGDEKPMARLIAGALPPVRLLTADQAAEELGAALEPARQEIAARTRTLRDQVTRPSAASRALADEVAGLRAEMDRLRDPGLALADLDVVREAGGCLGVLAHADQPARERVHAILEAAARGPVTDVALATNAETTPTQADSQGSVAMEIMGALRKQEPDGPAPWDSELTPLKARFAAYALRKEQERAAAETPAPKPAPAPEPEPGTAPKPRRTPGSEPGPGS